MKESYDKRLNILFYWIKENGNQAREKRDETVKKFPNFLKWEGKSKILKTSFTLTFTDYYNTT